MGLCWGMLHNPSLKGKHSAVSSLSDSIVMSGWLPNTTYFVRAYVTTSAGTVYGKEVGFATLPSDTMPALPEGALPGLFSVSEGEQVRFSKGNLQYQASTKTWRFADQQYDVIGMDNEKISETYSGWIDLFGWGTSGYDHGAVFLPAAGVRLIDGIHLPVAAYHTATAATECIWVLMFGEPLLTPGAYRGDGFSVRLVQDVE